MACNSAIVDSGNRILNTLNGIMLLSLPLATLYMIAVPFWLVLSSNLVNITDFTLLNFKYPIFTESKTPLLSHCSCVYGSSSCILWTAFFLWGDFWLCLWFCVLLHTTSKWFIFPHMPHILPYAGHCFCGCVILQYLQFPVVFLSFILSLCCLLPFQPGLCLSLIESKSFTSLMFPLLHPETFMLQPLCPN